MSSLVRFFTGKKSAADLTSELLHELEPYFPNCGRLLPPATPTSAAALAAAQAATGAAADAKSASAGTAAAGTGTGTAAAVAATPKAGGSGAAAASGDLVTPTHAGGGPRSSIPNIGGGGGMSAIKEIDDKTIHAISATLAEIEIMLYGDGETEAKPENIKKILDDLMVNELLLVLLAQMRRLDFEARKDVAAVYTFALKNRKDEMIAYVQRHPDILGLLVNGYNYGEMALQCGLILRDAFKHEVLLSAVLAQPLFVEAFFQFVQLPTFDVASDAFATFKTLLTKHKSVCAKYLEKNFDTFFGRFTLLLQSTNYVVKRQSLKLLGEMLMNRNYYGMMIKYVTSAEHLKVILGVLRSNTKAVQIEAFHVFKIFIANPNKSQPVIKILLMNREKLSKFISDFNTEATDAAAVQQFNDEKTILLQSLAGLNAGMLTPTTAAATPTAAGAATPTSTATPPAAAGTAAAANQQKPPSGPVATAAPKH